MKMFKLIYVILFSIGINGVLSQVVSNVFLKEHQQYMINVVQETMNEVEGEGWSNLKIPDFSRDISQAFYGWSMDGVVHYKNGFCVSIGSMELVWSTLQQFWIPNADGTVTADVRGNLHIKELALGFDVEYVPNSGETQNATGIFTHENAIFIFAVRRNIQTGVFTTSVISETLSGGTRRMIYLPETRYTEAMQREYRAYFAGNGVDGWTSQVFNRILLDVVTTKVQFPEICYNCSQ